MTITRASFETLQAIEAFIAEHKFSPTLRELMAIHGLASPAPVQSRVNRLIAAKVVSVEPNKSRTLRVLISSDRFTPIGSSRGKSAPEYQLKKEAIAP
jgi:repressor LexA